MIVQFPQDEEGWTEQLVVDLGHSLSILMTGYGEVEA
jgi:hypothetical protein